MLNYNLTRTHLINTHGLHLASTVDPYSLADQVYTQSGRGGRGGRGGWSMARSLQVAISYGYGSVKWGEDPYNAVIVPDALFSVEEDESQ